jgi:hypothetical protein
LKRPIPILVSLILIFLIYNFIFPFSCLQRSNQILGQNLFDIKKNDTISALNIDAAAHNKVLIDVLQQRLAIDYSSLTSSLSIKMQFRLFYTAILAGLSSLLFSTSISNKTKNIVIRRVLLSMIIIMYLLEVHFDDLYTRKDDVSKVKYMSVDSLVNLKPNDSTWYDLNNKWETSDSESVAAKWDSVSKGNVPRIRKLKAALSLNVEQIVYYWFPWFFLFYYPYYPSIKKTRYIRQYGLPRFKGS